MLASSNSLILVELQASEIVACVDVEKSGLDCCIGMLAVKPSLQGKGTARKMLALAESHAVSAFAARRFVLVVVSARTELIAYYLRRGYRKTGCIGDYPLSADAGTPQVAGLKIETLEKFPSDVCQVD
jgi:ribosomal protein S18 acetylase RimI-like enzyme